MATAAVGTPSLYKERQGSSYLSKTFESSVLLTPTDTNRITISPERYSKYRNDERVIIKKPWGRKYSYGGLGPVQFPINPNQPHVQKGHLHYGSGTYLEPRGVTVQQQYKITPLKKSNLRSSDEMVPGPTKVDLSKHELSSSYPIEHPYATHIEKTNLFPTFDVSETNPSSKPDIKVLELTRGNGRRHEVLTLPLNSQQETLNWNNGPNYLELLRLSNKRERQNYYPIPKGEMTPRITQSNLSHATRKALADLRTSQWKTTYARDFDLDSFRKLQNNKMDGEENLVNISSLPNSRVPYSLLIQNKSGAEKKSVEELTGKLDHDKRMVRFENESTGNIQRLNSVSKHGWSPSKMQQTNNLKYRDPVPDLRRIPDLRITPQEKRHHIQEAGGVGSYIFNGQYVPS